jgi:hypothetical protein
MATSTITSDTSSTPVTPNSPQPPQPTATPRLPQKTYPVDEDKATTKGLAWAADAGVSTTLTFNVTSPGARERWMHSSTSPSHLTNDDHLGKDQVSNQGCRRGPTVRATTGVEGTQATRIRQTAAVHVAKGGQSTKSCCDDRRPVSTLP